MLSPIRRARNTDTVTTTTPGGRGGNLGIPSDHPNDGVDPTRLGGPGRPVQF